jgi:hypothetical protein
MCTAKGADGCKPKKKMKEPKEPKEPNDSPLLPLFATMLHMFRLPSGPTSVCTAGPRTITELHANWHHRRNSNRCVNSSGAITVPEPPHSQPPCPHPEAGCALPSRMPQPSVRAAFCLACYTERQVQQGRIQFIMNDSSFADQSFGPQSVAATSSMGAHREKGYSSPVQGP